MNVLREGVGCHVEHYIGAGAADAGVRSRCARGVGLAGGGPEGAEVVFPSKGLASLVHPSSASMVFVVVADAPWPRIAGR